MISKGVNERGDKWNIVIQVGNSKKQLHNVPVGMGYLIISKMSACLLSAYRETHLRHFL